MFRKFVVMAMLSLLVLIGLESFRQGKKPHDNLLVLPKDISPADLDSVMNNYEKALGVSCDFCHTKDKKDSLALDFASDNRPEKEITRMMMRMTEMINKEYFDYTIQYKVGELLAVNCNTCHRGKPRPESENLR